MKLRGHDTKWRLPPEILDRPKMGFAVPLGSWLRGPFRNMVDEYILSERSLRRGIFNAKALKHLVAEHDAGEDHTARMFRLMNLEIWHRIFIDGETPERTS